MLENVSANEEIKTVLALELASGDHHFVLPFILHSQMDGIRGGAAVAMEGD